MKLTPTIGLEMHAELRTASKLFCTCSTEFGADPNANCCPGCSGFPGTLPALNKKAIEFSMKAGFITGCEISKFNTWDRKHYFYPDLPNAFQTTQLAHPICVNGKVVIKVNGEDKAIRINRIHLEEDAGKLVHDESSRSSLADYNRTSIPLIELVTEPDFHSADEVVAFVEKIRQLYQYTEICDGKMEQGSLRCDINISLAPPDAEKLGVRSEIKNVNSIRSIVRAIEYEIYRHTEAIELGETLYQETRRFNDATGETTAMRTKENAQDYRYYQTFDIPPLVITEEEIEAVRRTLPVLPEERLRKYTEEYNIAVKDAEIIINDKRLSDFFDGAVSVYYNPKAISSFIISELMRRINLGEANLETLPFTAADFGRLVEIGYTDKISRSHLKDVLREMLETKKTAEQICNEQGLWIKEDLSLVEATIDKILADNPKALEQYKNGEQKVIGFLMGQANKALKGAATPAVIKNVLEQKLNS